MKFHSTKAKLRIKTREHKLYDKISLEGNEISIPDKTAQVSQSL